MTTRDLIINAQIDCSTPWAKQPIMILTPIAVIESLGIAPDWFYLFDPTPYHTDGDAYVYLRLFPDYAPETNKLGGEGLKPLYSGMGYSASTVQRGFKATIIQKERVIYDIIYQLILISESSKFNQFSPIKIIDFCRVEVGDRIAYQNKLATVRYGQLMIESLPSLSYNQNYYKDNWNIGFTESKLRLK
jgi:hypothetical protein